MTSINGDNYHPQTMKTLTTTTTTTLLALAAAPVLPPAHALPSQTGGDVAAPQQQSVTLIFQAGPASYNLTFPADGREHPTGEDALGVGLVVAPDYDPYRYCTFRTAARGGRAAALAPSLVQRPGVDAWPVNEVAVGPPQPILAVACSGVCLGVYGGFPLTRSSPFEKGKGKKKGIFFY